MQCKVLLQHVVATMSDRAATEVKFNTLLHAFKQEVMESVYPNFAELSEAEQQDLCRLANFVCGLHALIHFAEVAEQSMLQIETELLTEQARTRVLGKRSVPQCV